MLEESLFVYTFLIKEKCSKTEMPHECHGASSENVVVAFEPTDSCTWAPSLGQVVHTRETAEIDAAMK